ncbi:hypothetical protein SAMN05216554_3521 [Herbiconiux ginsengi]|uniref:Uncharacterized protein n=2 Tax=Herbiconiux ginsengi TaxID=381665 RepID=A0A1H3SPF2_9MICO|nr:hypothetical protein SAMN05216554_3521 [Herbiconiux ginsengi]
MLIQITNTGGVALDNYLLAVQYGGPVYGMGVMPSETTLEIAGTTYPLSNPTFVDRSVFESRLYENTAGLAEDGVDFVAVRITGFIEGGGYSENCTLSVLLGDPYAEFPNFEFIGTSPQFVMKFVP